MSHILLEALYEEYNILTERLKSISHLIISYGGRIPSPEVDLKMVSTAIDKFNKNLGYPSKGTWKEKIIFTLYLFTEPVTAIEIADKMKQEFEKDEPYEYLKNTVTQYCSQMGLNNEISVDKSGFKNKYYMPSLFLFPDNSQQ